MKAAVCKNGVSRLAADPGSVEPELNRSIRRRIDACGYRFCFSQVEWSVEDKTLVLRGRVPSFYLKQVLQTLFRDLDDIRYVDNRVDVVNSTGLSSSVEQLNDST